MNRKSICGRLQAICINLCVALPLGCSDQETEHQSYLDDARAFCAVHESENWGTMPNEMSADELNKLVIARELDSVKTQRFKDLIKQLGKVQFYRELYPTAKREIEAITGAEWNCPPYEAFAALKVQREDSESPLSPHLRPDIIVSSSRDYFLGNQLLDLQSDQLKEFIANKGLESPLIIKLEEGVADDALQPLFQILGELKVKNVSVISD